MRVTRVVFLGVPAWGHVNPTLGVVAELVRRGHAVTYHCGEPHRAAIEATGAGFCAYEPGWIQNDMPHDGDVVGLGRVIGEAARRIRPALAAELRRQPADVIVHDSLALWGKELAAELDVPAVCSTTTLVFDRRVALSRPELLARIAAQHARQPKALVEIRGLFEMLSNREPLNLVYTSRAFQPFGDTYDARFAFVGPVLRDEAPLDPELASLDSPIYVSLGTLFNDRRAIFRAAAEGLSRLGHPVVISTGGRLDPDTLGPLPSDVIARAWVPQLGILRRASLAVTHAGMNSVNEALYFDVPLVLLPQAADQTWVAHRVAELGAGVVVRDPDADLLRSAARRALDDAAIRSAARAIGGTLRDAGGAQHAADAIVRMATQIRGRDAHVESAGPLHRR